MKKVLFLAAVALTISSCSTEWSANDEKIFMDQCKKMGSIDCDCALEKVKKAYPNINDWNEKGGKDKELAGEIATSC
jgi:hypothetical protein